MSDARGRTTESPAEIPAQGWKDTAFRVKDELSDDHTSLVAAGVSFFIFVALIPGLAAAISVYGLVSDPAQMENQLSRLLGNLPEEARQLVTDQISRLAEQSTGVLTWGTVIAVAVALWAASSGMSNLIEATNVAYDEKDDRSFVVKRGLALLFTIGAVAILVVAAFGVTAVGPWVSDVTGSNAVGWTARVVTWLFAGVAFMFGLAMLYRVGPNRDHRDSKWVSVGSIVAVILWLAASIVFRVYVANFGTYNETYGSLAAVVILLFWLYLTSFVVLLGAEINAELEHQTGADSEVGADDHMGKRRAEMADKLGQRRSSPTSP